MIRGLLFGLGALLIGCAPTSNVGWQKKVANRIKFADVDDIEVVRVTRYRQEGNRRDLLNSAEAIGYTSQYGIGIDQNFSRDGRYDAYMVEWKYNGMISTRFMRFDKFGNAIDRKSRW